MSDPFDVLSTAFTSPYGIEIFSFGNGTSVLSSVKSNRILKPRDELSLSLSEELLVKHQLIKETVPSNVPASQNYLFLEFETKIINAAVHDPIISRLRPASVSIPDAVVPIKTINTRMNGTNMDAAYASGYFLILSSYGSPL